MIKKIDKNADRKVRHERVRKTVYGTGVKPRLCVYRSTNYIYAQLIDVIFRSLNVSKRCKYFYQRIIVTYSCIIRNTQHSFSEIRHRIHKRAIKIKHANSSIQHLIYHLLRHLFLSHSNILIDKRFQF